jgi:transcriptional regulator with XRE-family HTH domain
MLVVELSQCFFPPPSIVRLVVELNWRDRLREAIARSGRKHSAIAHDAGIAPETLSRILSAANRHPSFETIVRIAHAVNENVGWLVNERGFSLSTDEEKQLRKVARILNDALAAGDRRERHEPNAAPAGAPGVEIPRAYANRGARLVYEALGDSMIGAGIAERDLLFVRPLRGMREAAGKIVICRVDGSVYVKVLDTRGGRIYLLSRNDRYPPIEVSDPSQTFEVIGVVVGRAGAV